MTPKSSSLTAEMMRLSQLQRTGPVKPRPAPAQALQTKGPSFAEVLKEKVATPDINFSAHAVSRLIERNISLSHAELDRIRSGVGKAEAKGAKESLVLLNDMAFVVSVKNHTVITAMSGPSVKENVFTNIDSAVIV